MSVELKKLHSPVFSAPRLAGKIKLLLYYYFSGLPFAVILALGITVTAGSLVQDYGTGEIFTDIQFMSVLFFINLVLFGTAAGSYIYNRFRRHEYILYYNKGLSLKQLFLFALLGNAILAVCLFLLLVLIIPGV